ncbi:MAG: signal peptide peptidase SppA [Myxococcales bacterium]|nr:signal peptide peptidase SppA [Myxococcales bacterium]
MPRELEIAMIGIGVAVSLILLIGIVRTLIRRYRRKRLPGSVLLELNLSDALPEIADERIQTMVFGKQKSTVLDVVSGLRRAALNPRVKGLWLRIGTPSLGMARLQEVRDAISLFREAGKPTIAFAETFGEGRGGNGAYYLATACDEIYIQPSGDVELTGLVAEAPFVKKALEKLGVKPRLENRSEYKNAINMFTETGYNDPHREATERYLHSLQEQIAHGILASRTIDPAALEAYMNDGVYDGAEALRLGLVDDLLYFDEVEKRLKEKFGAKTRRLSLTGFMARLRVRDKKPKTVALIYGVGNVMRGPSRSGGLMRSQTMGSDTVTHAFRKAIADKKVKAILFRVDSRGGSYVASDTIWRAVREAREKNKPVVATMGDIAGSGGYFVAMGADKVVAHPGTLTGSIGVITGKFVTRELWNRLGVDWDDVRTHENAALFSMQQDFTETQWAQLQATLDRIYEAFKQRVAESRGLEPAQVEEVARGRVWSGTDAMKAGLVDRLGGYQVAFDELRELLGVSSTTPLRLKRFPARKSLWSRLKGRDASDEPRPLAPEAAALLGPIGELGEQLGLSAPSGVLTVPDPPMPPVL